MGLGKTLSTLIAINDLRMIDDLGKTLIIAPKSVALNTWPTEIEKWDDTRHLTYSLVLGKRSQRERALAKEVDLYIINCDNIIWLVEYFGKKWPFKTVVIDEISNFKNPTAKRFRALRRVRPLMKRIIGLTGTPAPNNYIELWPELYLLDRGQRLGKTLTGYRQQYFHPGQRSGYVVYSWILNDGSKKAIFSKIQDIVISMDRKDFLKLPKRTDNIIKVKMTEKEKDIYRDLEKNFVYKMVDDDGEITAVNSAVLSNKLLQLANGAIYDDDGKTAEIHDHKLEALEEIVQEAQGQPILVFYQYKHDLERILKKFPEAQQLNPNSDDVKKWNQGKIPILLAQPQSAGHGLNLQEGGHIGVWFGLTWSLEYYQQANARIDRSGQTQPVIIHHLVTENTIDERVMNVLMGKAKRQDELLTAVKAVLEN